MIMTEAAAPDEPPVDQAKLKSCTCESCVRACNVVPGWFTPRDVKRLIIAHPHGWQRMVAFDRHEWYRRLPGTEFDDLCNYNVTVVMTPPNASTPAGHFYPTPGRWEWLGESPRIGTCALLHQGLCTIHAYKPRECREALPCDKRTDDYTRRARIARAWARPAAVRFLEYVQHRLATNHSGVGS